jgi:predicted dienelactone hydrolase
MMRRLAALAPVLLLMARFGHAAPCPTTGAAYAARGTHAIGVRTLTLVDTSRPTSPNGTYPGAPSRTVVTEVWYPTDGPPSTTPVRDAPFASSGGPFPLIVSSHGFLDSRVGEAYVTEHLASRGFVIAAPDYPLSNGRAPGGATVTDLANQPGDVRFVIDQMLATFGAPVDAARIGATGLSLGGSTTLLATFHPTFRDPRIGAALPIAPGGCFFTKRFFRTTKTPLLILHGDDDLLVTARQNATRPFRLARGPHAVVLLRGGSHTGFSQFATAFPGTIHPDCIGCAAIASGGIAGDTVIPGLGGRSEGVEVNPDRCAAPCEAPLPCAPNPTRQALAAARQHELTRIIAAAFFDATLKDDTEADCFVRRGLKKETSEVVVRSRRRF